MFSMMIVLLVVFYSEVIFGQESTFTDLDGRTFSIILTEINSTFRSAQCPIGSEMITYQMTQTMQMINFTWSGSIWIHASAKYTPWMLYKGISYIRPDELLNSTIAIESGNQLYTCITSCHKYWGIGLQDAKCVCVKEELERFEHQRDIDCKDKYKTVCARSNYTNSITIYKNDLDRIMVNGLGECMTVRTNATNTISYNPKRCNSNADAYVMVGPTLRNVSWITSISGFPRFQFRIYRLGITFPKDLRKYNEEGEFWSFNVREPIFFGKAPPFNDPSVHCVSGISKNGKIELQTENCSNSLPTVCYRYTDQDSNSPETTVTDYITVLNTETGKMNKSGSEIYVIPTLIIMAVLVGVLVLMLRWKFKMCKNISSSTAHSHNAQARAGSSQYTSLQSRIDGSEHEYHEVRTNPEMSIPSAYEDVDNYIASKTSKDQQVGLSCGGTYEQDMSRQVDANIYSNELHVVPIDSFNRYQALGENRHSDGHIYTPVSNESAYENI